MNSHRPGNHTNVSGRRVHGDTHMLSIIIPTLNEEKYLPILLQSIKKQALPEHEIIVSDGSSTDATVIIARKNRCKVIISNKRSPAIQRNAGASVARGDVLLFLDADSVLPEHFIPKSLAEFSSRKLDVGAYYCVCNSDKLKYKLATVHASISMFLIHLVFPICIGAAIIVRKSVHDAIGGFDETIRIGEDHEYCRTIVRHAFRYGLLRSTYILFSVRRFDREGLGTIAWKWYYLVFYYLTHGPVRSPVVPYEFGKYNETI